MKNLNVKATCYAVLSTALSLSLLEGSYLIGNTILENSKSPNPVIKIIQNRKYIIASDGTINVYDIAKVSNSGDKNFSNTIKNHLYTFKVPVTNNSIQTISGTLPIVQNGETYIVEFPKDGSYINDDVYFSDYSSNPKFAKLLKDYYTGINVKYNTIDTVKEDSDGFKTKLLKLSEEIIG